MDGTAGTVDSAWLSKDPKPFKQGAEACLYRCTYFGRKAVIKERFVKVYRCGGEGKYIFDEINNFQDSFDHSNLLLTSF